MNHVMMLTAVNKDIKLFFNLFLKK